MSAASDITRKAKSNLAFALNILPRDRRDDMVVFYAFCRTMDDLADDPSIAGEEREKLLLDWKSGILQGFKDPNTFQQEFISLRDRRRLPDELLVAIIDGCMMDLKPQRFQTQECLSGYVWKVACAVGLVSIRIFGCQDPGSERYAVALGQALQLTNILRDIREDIENGQRIYLPLEDLAQFGVSEGDFFTRSYDDRFIALMEYEAQRAEIFFQQAEAALPAVDRKALLPARIMAEIYHVLLTKMRADRFRVFEKRYHVSKFRKFTILLKHLIARSH